MIRLLLFNLAMDLDDPILGFSTRWIQALAERVERIHVITMRAGRIEVPDNVQVYSVGKEKEYSKPRRAVEFYRHLSRVLRENSIDVCFAHMMPLFTVLAGPVLKAKGIPIVTWYAHPSLTWILRLADHLSTCMVTSIATAYPYKDDKLRVIGQGIDTALFSPDGLCPTEPPKILCVGRLSAVKDHPTLLRAAWLLRKRWNKPFEVRVVGGHAGPRDALYVEALHRQVKELELEQIVSFEPPVPILDLPSWYQWCTLHVNLTPTGSADKVAWEAMACGRPCLVANEGFKDTLGEYADRLVFCYGNPEDLAERVDWALSLSNEDRALIGSYLRQRVVSMHSISRLANTLMHIFEGQITEASIHRQNNKAKHYSR
jgi:glycosyltransferase involved in cell wall biosynthesis